MSSSLGCAGCPGAASRTEAAGDWLGWPGCLVTGRDQAEWGAVVSELLRLPALGQKPMKREACCIPLPAAVTGPHTGECWVGGRLGPEDGN